MSFDIKEWREMLTLDDEMDPTTRMLLAQYSMYMDSAGRAYTKAKVMARTVGITEKEVRRRLIDARNAEWLEPIKQEGKRGYRATLPESLM